MRISINAVWNVTVVAVVVKINLRIRSVVVLTVKLLNPLFAIFTAALAIPVVPIFNKLIDPTAVPEAPFVKIVSTPSELKLIFAALVPVIVNEPKITPPNDILKLLVEAVFMVCAPDTIILKVVPAESVFAGIVYVITSKLPAPVLVKDAVLLAIPPDAK